MIEYKVEDVFHKVRSKIVSFVVALQLLGVGVTVLDVRIMVRKKTS